MDADEAGLEVQVAEEADPVTVHLRHRRISNKIQIYYNGWENVVYHYERKTSSLIVIWTSEEVTGQLVAAEHEEPIICCPIVETCFSPTQHFDGDYITYVNIKQNYVLLNTYSLNALLLLLLLHRHEMRRGSSYTRVTGAGWHTSQRNTSSGKMLNALMGAELLRLIQRG